MSARGTARARGSRGRCAPPSERSTSSVSRYEAIEHPAGDTRRQRSDGLGRRPRARSRCFLPALGPACARCARCSVPRAHEVRRSKSRTPRVAQRHLVWRPRSTVLVEGRTYSVAPEPDAHLSIELLRTEFVLCVERSPLRRRLLLVHERTVHVTPSSFDDRSAH